MGNRFIAKTDLHQKLANQCLQPLMIASYAQGAADNFCTLHMEEEKGINAKKPLEHIILYQLVREYPRAVEGLQNNYGLLPFTKNPYPRS